MVRPLRKTRRRIAYWSMLMLTSIVGWVIFQPDISATNTSIAMVLIPSLVGVLMTFIGGESFNDHSERGKQND